MSLRRQALDWAARVAEALNGAGLEPAPDAKVSGFLLGVVHYDSPEPPVGFSLNWDPEARQWRIDRAMVESGPAPETEQ